MGKLGAEAALPALLAVAGIDLLGRLKALTGKAGSSAAVIATLGTGATGLLNMVTKFPHIGVVLLTAATVGILLPGCGAFSNARDTVLKTGQEVINQARPVVDNGLFLCGDTSSDVCRIMVAAKQHLEAADLLLKDTKATLPAIEVAVALLIRDLNQLEHAHKASEEDAGTE